MNPQNRSVDTVSESVKLDRRVSSSELAQLLMGLERQKEELGPIAVELIDLLHRLGVGSSPRQADLVNPSNG